MIDPKIVIQYLTILELPIDHEISKDVIHSQYRKLTLLYHPDVAPQRYKDGKKFVLIREATDYLKANLDEINHYIRNDFVVSASNKNSIRTSSSNHDRPQTTNSTNVGRSRSHSSIHYSDGRNNYYYDFSDTNETTIEDKIKKDLTLLDGYHYVSDGTPLSFPYFFALNGQLYYVVERQLKKFFVKGIYSISYNNERHNHLPFWLDANLIKLLDIEEKKGSYPCYRQIKPYMMIELLSIDKERAAIRFYSYERSGQMFKLLNAPHDNYQSVISMNDPEKCPVCSSSLKSGQCIRKCHRIIGYN